MTLKIHYWKALFEILMLFGALMLIPAILMQVNNLDSVSITTVWGILLFAVTLVFRGHSLINLHDLEEPLMRQNYLISSVIADLSLLALLYYYLPGGKYFYGKEWQILGAYIVFKGLFYLMNYLFTMKSAREINNMLKKSHR